MGEIEFTPKAQEWAKQHKVDAKMVSQDVAEKLDVNKDNKISDQEMKQGLGPILDKDKFVPSYGGLSTSQEEAVSVRFDKIDIAMQTVKKNLTGLWVTNAEATKAHETLIALDKDIFNDTVQRTAFSAQGTEILNNYIKELNEADPGGDSVKQFAEKLAKDGDQRTIKLLMQKLDTESWGLLMQGFSGMSDKDETAFVTTVGNGNPKVGAQILAAKNVYEMILAQKQGLADTYGNIGSTLETVSNLLGGKSSLVSGFIGFYGKGIGAIPQGAVNAFYTNVKDGGTSGSDRWGDERFIESVSKEMKMDIAQVRDLTKQIKGIYKPLE